MSDWIDELLDDLSIGTQQMSHPPYTENNKPQGLIYIKGKSDAAAEIHRRMVDERIDELEAVLKTSARIIMYEYEDGTRVPVEQRIQQLKAKDIE